MLNHIIPKPETRSLHYHQMTHILRNVDFVPLPSLLSSLMALNHSPLVNKCIRAILAQYLRSYVQTEMNRKWGNARRRHNS